MCYCMDCRGVFCRQCSDRVHQANDADHSVQEIAGRGRQGVHIFTPLADELILIIVFCYAASRTSFPPDYFAGSKYCPFLERIRGRIAGMDAGAVHLMHSTLHEACGIEDSFWRFYGDAWARSIVTGSDSAVVLLTSAFSLLFSDVAVVYIMIPLISCAYALLFWFLHWLESLLPRMLSLTAVEGTLGLLNVIDLVDDQPPVTLARKRAATDPVDWLTYPIRRTLRVPRYFYERISSKLEALVYWSSGFTLIIRVACVLFGPQALVPLFLLTSLLAVVYGRHCRCWPMNGLRQFVFLVLVMLVMGGFAARAYKKHLVLFASVSQRQALSEHLFWHVVKGVLYIGREEAAKLLGALTGVAATILLALPLVWSLAKRPFGQTNLSHA